MSFCNITRQQCGCNVHDVIFIKISINSKSKHDQWGFVKDDIKTKPRPESILIFTGPTDEMSWFSPLEFSGIGRMWVFSIFNFLKIIFFKPPSIPACRYVEDLLCCNAGRQEVSRCHTRGEPQVFTVSSSLFF